MKRILALVVSLGFLVSAATPAPAAGPSAPGVSPESPDPGAVLERGWIVRAADNICGLRDANQLSNPAKLNYKRCLAATPELKKMKDEGIAPESPEGIQLTNAAATRVGTAANTVRKAGGFCSVWKEISHADGRSISDITARVISQY